MKTVLVRALLATALSLFLGSAAHAGDPPSDVKSTIKEDAKTTGHAVSHSAKTVGHTVADKSKTAGHAIADASKKIASDVKEGTQKAWSAVSGSKSHD
jgi:hypothetical protein